ncbi:Small glutamine-rich tetratricopeptide repeat-containing protein 2 [Friedmanniomyces endolithicus]|nr:Small glutamine-rich tetratricopeptide repeat-containing protein 2 [Friedmanniomyces endolithicus]
MATDTRKRLALAIIDFLSTSLKDGTLQSEDADSIEIAQNCIAECFHVDPADQSAMKDALGGQNLLAVYGVYEKMKGKNTSSAAGAAPSASKSTSSTVPKAGEKGGPTDASEKLKGNGNTAMQRKDYKSAIDLYTKALEIAPLNPIYLSNRAAAYSANSQHELAKNDAELAVADPKYTKAWSRLGLACFALGDAKSSMEAYQKGIEAEGNGGSDAMKKGFETAKRRVEEEGGADDEEDEEDDDSSAIRSAQGGGAGGGGMPDLGGLAAMLGGAGGGGAGGGGMPDLGGLAAMLGGAGGAGGGGMPDLSSIMQNPMMRQMAQSMMSNPEMMSNIMNNPQLRNMAGRFGGGGGGAAGGEAGSAGGGGGMPDLSAMMNDPNLAEMARNFMGGMGGAGAGRGAGRGAGGQ